MKNINLPFLLLLGLFFSACEKNIDETTILTVDEAPQLLDKSAVSGLVKDGQGNPIAGAEVTISHKGEEYALLTDQSGKYEIELPKDDQAVYLIASADDHMKSGVDRKILNESQVTNDFIIMSSTAMPFTPDSSPILLNDSLRVVSGQLLYANGNPLANKLVFLIDPVDFASFFLVYEVTDANGRFSFAHPPTENMILAVYDECNQLDIVVDDLDIADQDIDIGVFTTNFFETESLTFGGFVTDCNTGEGLVSGFVTVTLDGQIAASGEIVNGVYLINEENCNGSNCYDLKITTNLLQDATLELECLPIDGNINNKNYELCGDPVVSSSSGDIRVLIGTDSLIMEASQANRYVNFNLWEISGFNMTIDRGVFFQINGNSVGTYPVQMFVPDQTGLLFYYQPDSMLMNATIDVLETDKIKGTINGQIIEASTGLLLPMSGIFDINL